jgi:hypothetical protein
VSYAARVDPLSERERRLLAGLERELHALDDETLGALSRALARGETELTGGEWGSRDDGHGCLLSLAAWELGLEDGEALLVRSVAAVRVPALFDELWSLVLRRTGDVAEARAIAEAATRRAIERRLGTLAPAEPAACTAEPAGLVPAGV